MTVAKNSLWNTVASLLAVGLLSATLVAQPASAARYDNQIQTAVTQRLAAKKQLSDVKSSVEDGIVTLTGTVDLYQRKLDAAKVVRKASGVQGVRNLVTVAGPSVPDEQLEQKLAKKLRYVRVGYDNTFDYFAIGVKDGVVTVEGHEPTSIFDDGIRLRTARAIYRDSVLSKYATDPAHPIRIIVVNGHVTLYGSVDNTMDKQVAGIRANQVFGAFTVDNQLLVESKSNQPGMSTCQEWMVTLALRAYRAEVSW